MTLAGYGFLRGTVIALLFGASVFGLTVVDHEMYAQEPGATAVVDLPSSKQMIGPMPGNPQRLNSLPISMAVSPDRRYVVTVNAGYGTFESGYRQSLAVMDTQTGRVTDFPDDRTGLPGKQTLYSGLAFSGDGRHLYASMASLSDPAGDGKKKTGNGVVVYSFANGTIAKDGFFPIPLQPLAGSRRTKLIGGVDGAVGLPYPAAIAVVSRPDGERLLVADNLSDDMVLMDASSGKMMTRFDVSESDAVPSTYPVALAVTKDGTRAFVALWNASEVVELDLAKGVVARKLALLKPVGPTAAGTHPCDLVLSANGTLYVALSNRDAVAALDVSGQGPAAKFAVKGYFDTRLPGQSYFGAEPVSLALSGDGRWLYAADLGSDAVATIDTRKLTASAARRGFVEPDGFIPTEWQPMSMALVGASGVKHETLYVATAKGKSTGPNNFAAKTTPETADLPQMKRGFAYIGTLLYGSLAAIDMDSARRNLGTLTANVMTSNRMKAAVEPIPFAGGHNPIKHAIYIIKENRTYDQLFGDLKMNGKPVGNADPSLTMYGEEITPNQHRMALQFGVLDNFYDSAEISGDGHVWSNAAIGTDYLEKTWQQDYRNGQHTYDYEGLVAEGYPILQRIPDVVEPASGYLWGNLASHGKTLYHFGEYISSTFCDTKKSATSQDGPVLEGRHCSPGAIQPGGKIPEMWGGGVNRWPWAIPLLANNQPTKPELVGHFAEETPDFNLRIPDQIRVAIFLRHLEEWKASRAAGNDTMPNFVMLRLANDHTGGTTPGGPTPKSSVADNDLAIGIAVDAISHSAYWDDTAFFILEDDAQNGADHVDAHRSMALVVSKYAPHAKEGEAFVDSRFYTTVSMIRTMEAVLGLPPMNNNDALSSSMGSLFSGPGDQKPFVVDYKNRDNGLIYKANTPAAVGAKESSKMDFSHADRADAQKMNVILWRDAMGDAAVPAQLTEKRRKLKKDDDDD